jgi:hypothetical protein
MFHANIECLAFSVLNSDKINRPNGFPSHVKYFTNSEWEIIN